MEQEQLVVQVEDAESQFNDVVETDDHNHQSTKEQDQTIELDAEAANDREEFTTSDDAGESDSDTTEETFDESSFISSNSYGKAARIGEAGVATIVNSLKNGNRFTIAKECWENLNNVKQLQFSFNDNQIAIAEELPGNDNYFNVRPYGAKAAIYSKDLVQEITETFDLDFSDRVSITLYDVQYVKNGEHTVAIITVK